MHGTAEALRPVPYMQVDERIAGMVASVRRVHQAVGASALHGAAPAQQLHEETETYTS